jgi:hypothetical protein
MDRPRWERQPGEGTRAHAAFAAYRDMGATRSLAKVAKTLGKSRALVERWSSAWDWVARAGAYDDFLDETKRAKAARLVEEMVERQLAQMLLIQQAGMEALVNLDFRALKPTEILDYIIAAAKQERVLRGQPECIVKKNQADAEGNHLPAPAPTIIQEILVTTRAEAQAILAQSRAEGIPVLTG